MLVRKWFNENGNLTFFFSTMKKKFTLTIPQLEKLIKEKIHKDAPRIGRVYYDSIKDMAAWQQAKLHFDYKLNHPYYLVSTRLPETGRDFMRILDWKTG